MIIILLIDILCCSAQDGSKMNGCYIHWFVYNYVLSKSEILAFDFLASWCLLFCNPLKSNGIKLIFIIHNQLNFWSFSKFQPKGGTKTCNIFQSELLIIRPICYFPRILRLTKLLETSLEEVMISMLRIQQLVWNVDKTSTPF